MGNDNSKAKLVKQLIKQISGNISEEDELIPEAAINGSGEIWCYDPVTKVLRRVYRGIKVYVLQEKDSPFCIVIIPVKKLKILVNKLIESGVEPRMVGDGNNSKCLIVKKEILLNYELYIQKQQ